MFGLTLVLFLMTWAVTRKRLLLLALVKTQIDTLSHNQLITGHVNKKRKEKKRRDADIERNVVTESAGAILCFTMHKHNADDVNHILMVAITTVSNKKKSKWQRRR